MSFVFDPQPREFKIDLPDGASVRLRVPYRRELPQGVSWQEYLISLIVDWDGIETASGAPLEMTEENKKMLCMEMLENDGISAAIFAGIGTIAEGSRRIWTRYSSLAGAQANAPNALDVQAPSDAK